MQKDEFERIAHLFFHFFETSIPSYCDLDDGVRRKGVLGIASIKVQKETGRTESVGVFDKKTEQRYFTFLAEHFPGELVVSEETEHTWPPSGDFWIIDPCDGTHNMLSGDLPFGTMVARVQNGVVTFSAIFLPAHANMKSGCFIAGRGHGAWEWSPNGNRRITVSQNDSLEKSLLCFEGPSGSVYSSPLFLYLVNRIEFSNKLSASCWAGVLTASGGNHPRGCDAIVTFRGRPWDNLPISLPVEEGGGKVTDHDGNPMTLENHSDLVMSNGRIHGPILAAIRAYNKVGLGI